MDACDYSCQLGQSSTRDIFCNRSISLILKKTSVLFLLLDFVKNENFFFSKTLKKPQPTNNHKQNLHFKRENTPSLSLEMEEFLTHAEAPDCCGMSLCGKGGTRLTYERRGGKRERFLQRFSARITLIIIPWHLSLSTLGGYCISTSQL